MPTECPLGLWLLILHERHIYLPVLGALLKMPPPLLVVPKLLNSVTSIPLFFFFKAFIAKHRDLALAMVTLLLVIDSQFVIFLHIIQLLSTLVSCWLAIHCWVTVGDKITYMTS